MNTLCYQNDKLWKHDENAVACRTDDTYKLSTA